jgi:spore maturation protein CgeB
MKFVVFGLSVSSAWGNGHATLWRGLIAALNKLGHEVVFFEKNTTYYAQHRDIYELPGRSRLVLYDGLGSIMSRVSTDLAEADVTMVTSYCPDGPIACDLVLNQPHSIRVFYDLDTPMTIECLKTNRHVSYLPQSGLAGFDLVLSYTGGPALEALRSLLGATRVFPLYGSVDPLRHAPAPPRSEWQAACSYLGTYASDRQHALEQLFLEPARRRPGKKFILGGSLYPESFSWTPNIWYTAHVSPFDHAAFYASSPLTVSVTRGPMAEMGFCPSGRLFEAAACGTPVLSDSWNGLREFFEPGSEILVAHTTEEAIEAIELPREELVRIGRRARERALDQHTATHRAQELIACLESAKPRHPREVFPVTRIDSV